MLSTESSVFAFPKARYLAVIGDMSRLPDAKRIGSSPPWQRNRALARKTSEVDLYSLLAQVSELALTSHSARVVQPSELPCLRAVFCERSVGWGT
jgi:hypothetical protein